VRRLARRLVGERAADDLAQDVHVAALTRGAGARGELRAWLAGVARNLARRLRSQEALRGRQEERAARLATERAENGERAALERMRLQRALAQAVLELRPPYRRAVIERHLDGRGYPEIARRLGVSEDVARKRVSRGVELLRQVLRSERGGEAWVLCRAIGRDASAPPSAPPAGGAGGAGASPVSLPLGALVMASKTLVPIAATVLLAASLGLWLGLGSDPAPHVEPRPPSLVPPAASVRADDGEAPAAAETALAEPHAAPRREVAADGEARARPAPDARVAGELRGRVLDSRGEPLEGASVEVRRDLYGEYVVPRGREPLSTRRGTLVARVGSGAGGWFAVPLPEGRPFDLWAEAPGHAPASLSGRFAGDHVELRLALPGALAGTVTRESDGRPVAAARVTGWKDDGSWIVLFDGVTDDAGRFQFEGLEPGPARVGVRAPGLTQTSDTVSVHIAPGARLERDFALFSGFTVEGTVVDAETGLPVEGARVGLGWSLQCATRTDAAGRFRVTGVPDRDYDELHAVAPGYARAAAVLGFGDDATIAVDLSLRPGFEAVGRVLGPAGAPLPGARVAAVSRQSGEGGMGLGDWVEIESDGDGRFALAPLRHDLDHALLVMKEGFGTRVVPFPPVGEAELRVRLGDVALTAGATLLGRVVDESGAGLPDCRLRLYAEVAPVGKNLDDFDRWNDDESFAGERLGRSDGQGRFWFADLEPGEYVLEVSRYPMGALTVTRVFDGTVSRRVQVGGGATEVELELAMRTAVSGRLVDPEGEPVASVMIWLRRTGAEEHPLNVVTGADGGFAFRGLERGEYVLTGHMSAIRTGGEVPAFADLAPQRVASGTRDLEIVLVPVRPTTGVLLAADGMPAPYASVTAVDERGRRVDLTYTDLEGRFALGLEWGQVVTLVALPAPEDAPYWDVEASRRIDPALACLHGPVEAGDAGLALRLPGPAEAAEPGAVR